MTPPEANTTQARGFRIRRTPQWWDLPLDPDTRDAEIAAFVAERRPDASPEQRREIIQILTGTAAAAHRLGAGLCAEYAAADEGGGLICANLMVTEIPVLLPTDELEDQAAAIAQGALTGAAAPRPTECSVVDLPEAGPAIRVRFDPLPRSSDQQPSGFDALRLQFFVAVPGSGTTALLTFSSPVLTGHEPDDELVELFDAMAETFYFVNAEGERIAPSV